MDANTTNNIERTHAAIRRSDIVEPDLSYEIVGALFRVYNELGPGLRERHYQRALANALQSSHVSFREQVAVTLEFKGKPVGRYFVDFLVAERVVLEIKQGDFCSLDHLLQVKRYLKALELRLGILANFGSRRVVYRRVLVAPGAVIRGIRGDSCS